MGWIVVSLSQVVLFHSTTGSKFMPSGTVTPPTFVMWKSLAQGENLGWQRQWFGYELEPTAAFNVRGVGICEPMFNSDVYRSIGTGDWLIMFFHEAARLDRDNEAPSVGPNTLILWPPGAAQFYSWGRAANVEPHSWTHVEGSWVSRQVEVNRVPTGVPITIDDEALITCPLRGLMDEMTQNESPDPIILRNLFENWMRAIARHTHRNDSQRRVPARLVRVREFLDEHFAEVTSLNNLAQIACMSRSHLCHQFRANFKTTISSYVVRRRMSIAQRLLFDMDRRPGEIARAVGYPDIYQFSKQFKKTFGISPTQFRKQNMQ